MNVKAESYGQAIILNCKGDLTGDSLEAFGREVDRHLAANPADVVLNLAEMGTIDSAGLEYLLDLQDRLAEKLGRLILVNLDENVAKILEITRLDGSLEISRDLAEAVKTL